ncbi:hypothetical protein Vadar_005924 [Vaccinium darrowii]|uniref:Uncharacterized protein n=1 Tax=Vaccinium darrowii TaxID=229202 RepID=A0ACB7YE51_9ERIC|nr:hypothetical protein Vadar_005924 [Vaccinium darrowii]
MKQHLAGSILGVVGACKKVSADVKYEMEQSLKAISDKKKESQDKYEESNPYGPSLFTFEGDDLDDDDVVEVGGSSGNKSRALMTRKGKGKDKEIPKVEMNDVQELANRASAVTMYIYNRPWLLAWLRKRPGWTEIVQPVVTRFATNFISLHCIQKHKCDLQALSTSKDFGSSRLLSHSCIYEDGDEKPNIGYVYEGMYQARLGINSMFKKKKSFYKPFTAIIKARWDRQLRKNIQAAAYWLNPAFQCDSESFCRKPEVMAGFLDVVDEKITSFGTKRKIMDEMRVYRDKLESFGREIALSSSKKTQPEDDADDVLEVGDDLDIGSFGQNLSTSNMQEDEDEDEDSWLELLNHGRRKT